MTTRTCIQCGSPFATVRSGPRKTCGDRCRRERERDLYIAKRRRRQQSSSVRWSAGQKARLVDAVKAGRSTLEEIRSRHNISVEEFAAWWQAYARGDVDALKIKRIPERRRTP